MEKIDVKIIVCYHKKGINNLKILYGERK